MESKVCFISDASNWVRERVDICPKANSSLTETSGARGYIDKNGGGGRLNTETAYWSLIVIFKLVISGLISIILLF